MGSSGMTWRRRGLKTAELDRMMHADQPAIDALDVLWDELKGGFRNALRGALTRDETLRVDLDHTP